MKKAKLFLVTLAMTAAMSISALAGQWQQDSTGWWYQNDDGTYPTACWQWIDGDNDGTAECYYFDNSGYCLMNTTTPDGNTVDKNGALMVSGLVQTKTNKQSSNTSQNSNTSQTATKADTSSQTTSNVSKTVWLSATGEKYHSIPNCGRMNPDKARQISLSEALEMGYTQCSKCY